MRLAVLSALLVAAFALVPAPLGQPADPVTDPADAGPNHRFVQWVQNLVDSLGQPISVTNSYVELGLGMNYWDTESRQWLPSVPEFEQTDDGYFVVRRTQHQVIVSPDLAVERAVDILTPDGVRLQSTPRGVALVDPDSGKSVMLGECASGEPEWVAPGEVIFREAFDGLAGSIRYRLTSTSIEQDVLLEEQIAPELVARLGLNPLRTRVVILTEFFDTAPTADLRTPDGERRLVFGAMQVGSGQVFRLDSDEAMATAPVKPSWELLEGRRFLVESVDYIALRPLMDALPMPSQGRIDALKSRVRRTASVVPSRLTPRKADTGGGARASRAPWRASSPTSWGEPLLTFGHQAANQSAASSARPSRSLVLDYALQLSTGQSNYLFKGDTTYHVTGPVPMDATTTFEAGCVIKYAPGSNAALRLKGPIVWQGSPYRPVVLTARDDTSVGDAVQGATNSPSGYYAAVALDIDRATNATPALLQYFRIAYAQVGIALNGATNHVFTHGQLVNCQRGFGVTNTDLSLRNVLFHGVLTNFVGSSSTGRCEHVTVNTANWCNDNNACSYLYFTNSLLAGVTNSGTLTVTNATAVLASADGVFQTVGQGANYLAAGSQYRNWSGASTNINGELAATLRSLTTYPPMVLSNDFMVTLTLGPRAQRDTAAKDLGFHYVPLDYCWSSLNLTNATLVLTNGVAVGFYGPKGTTLRNGAVFVSEGAPDRLNRLVRYTAVQEQPGAWATNFTSPFLAPVTANPLPEVRLRFTDVSFLADTASRRQLLGLEGPMVGVFELSHCQIRGAYVHVFNTTAYGMGLAWTNNLLQRCTIYLSQPNLSGYYGFALDAYNTLFLKGSVTLDRNYSGTTWTLKDNLFDCDTLSLPGTNAPTVSNTGYRTGLTTLGGTGNKTGLVPDYQGGLATNWFGALGNYYYPTNGAAGSLTNLIDTGSVTNAGLRGLYHCTTTTNQVKDAATTLDIGFHYAAADTTNGLPQDYDGDGLADYVEDRNGDGNCSGDTYCYTSSDTDNDGLSDLDAYDLSQNVLVNNPLNDYGNEQNTQWQPKVVALGDAVIVGYWDSNQGIWGLAATHPAEGLTNPTPCRMVAYSVSVDGGRTFSDMGVPPMLDTEWGDAGDPVLAIDRASGTIYYVGTSERYYSRGVPFWKSLDRGASFSRCPTIQTNITGSDYPWIAVDDWPGTGQHDLYLVIGGSYTNSYGPLWLTVSTDGSGTSWSTPTRIGSANAWMQQMVVGSDHVAYAAWKNDISSTSFSLETCAVSNRGASVSTNRTICQLRTANHPVHLFRDNGSPDTNDWFKAYVYPALGVNPSASRSNHLYVAYLDKSESTNDRADVFFTRSSDGGVTWTSPLRVNLDGTTNDQWMPSLAMRPDGNQLFVGWLDRRNDTNNSLIDVYGRWASIATNGTVTFSTNDFRITTESFPPAYGGCLTINTNMGYYDPVWPSANVDLHWIYDWWFNTWPVPDGCPPEECPPQPHLTDAESYARLIGEHNGVYADMNHVYFVWSDSRLLSMGTLNPSRREADVRLVKLRWPNM